jgi:AbiTii
VSLLLEIQDAAVGADVSLPVLLRKCQVLAARLGHDPLRDWARSEVEGYSDVADLPDYRKIGPLEAVGSFVGGGQFWPQIPIPRGAVPEDRRDRLFAYQFLQGVAELEPLAAAPPDTAFSIAWPSDDIARYGTRIVQDAVCLAAHVDITPHLIAGVLDTIRNRVLSFSLEIWKEDPEAGEAPAPGQTQVASQRVDQIFHTYVMAPVAAITIGRGEINQTVNLVIPGDIASLRTALAQLGVADSDIGDLDQALAQDEATAGTGTLGPATATWLQRFRAQTGEQTVALANGVTAGMITELLMRFLG